MKAKINPMVYPGLQPSIQRKLAQYDWSESGLNLLTIFEAKIRQEGGHFSLWSKMRKELQPVLQRAEYPKRKAKRSPWKHQYARYLIDNWKTLNYAAMVKHTGMSPAGLSRLAKGLRLKSKPIIYNGPRVECRRSLSLVLDLETGIYYFNMNECARAVNVHKGTFGSWLKFGRRTDRFIRLV